MLGRGEVSEVECFHDLFVKQSSYEVRAFTAFCICWTYNRNGRLIAISQYLVVSILVLFDLLIYLHRQCLAFIMKFLTNRGQHMPASFIHVQLYGSFTEVFLTYVNQPKINLQMRKVEIESLLVEVPLQLLVMLEVLHPHPISVRS